MQTVKEWLEELTELLKFLTPHIRTLPVYGKIEGESFDGELIEAILQTESGIGFKPLISVTCWEFRWLGFACLLRSPNGRKAIAELERLR